MARRLRAVRDKLKPGAHQRRYMAEPGTLQIPAAFYRDMLDSDARHERLNGIDLQVFGFVVGAVENRELPDWVVKRGLATLESDGTVVAHESAHLPFGHVNVDGNDQVLSRNQYERSLKRLQRYQWLEVKAEGTPQDGTTRISYGERYKRWLEDGEGL